jgi:uncharacterized protein (DUF983 family)
VSAPRALVPEGSLPPAEDGHGVALLAAVLKGAWAGLRLRCPECRAGRIVQGRYTARRRCPACGYEFLPGRGEFTGALLLAQGLIMVLAAIAYVVIRARTDWSPAWVGAALLAFLVLAPILAYPHLRGIWIGLLHGSSRADPSG